MRLTQGSPNGLRGLGAGAGVDSVWDQEKPEATLREMFNAQRAAEFLASTISNEPVYPSSFILPPSSFPFPPPHQLTQRQTRRRVTLPT
jgi:hypothetical protein